MTEPSTSSPRRRALRVNPDWYYNLVAAGAGEQARRLPQFAEHAEQTAGIRTIPVLGLRRA